MTSATWSVSPTHLVGCFREALLAMVPIAEKIHMPWREPQSYDDWDIIAAALYEAIVIRSIENAGNAADRLPLARYDVRSHFYGDRSYLTCEALGPDHAFICLETRVRPFDTCLFAKLDGASIVTGHARPAIEGTEFKLLSRTAGSHALLAGLEVRL
jgi:hypothetical protein